MCNCTCSTAVDMTIHFNHSSASVFSQPQFLLLTSLTNNKRELWFYLVVWTGVKLDQPVMFSFALPRPGLDRTAVWPSLRRTADGNWSLGSRWALIRWMSSMIWCRGFLPTATVVTCRALSCWSVVSLPTATLSGPTLLYWLSAAPTQGHFHILG